MRIDLSCPFDQKDKAKALGAKWDAAKKVWYIVDVEDLTPFMRWISRPSHLEPSGGKPSKKKPKPKRPQKDYHATVTTGVCKPMCNCDALPWEDCEHTDALAMQAMHTMLTMLTVSPLESPTHA